MSLHALNWVTTTDSQGDGAPLAQPLVGCFRKGRHTRILNVCVWGVGSFKNYVL